ALDRLEALGPCDSRMWAWIRPAAVPPVGEALRKLDIELYSEQGEARVRLLGFTSRVLPAVPEDGGERLPEPETLLQPAGEDYLSRFGGQEFFLRDHGGMLPAAVYLEMARAAAALRGGASVVALSQVVWP